MIAALDPWKKDTGAGDVRRSAGVLKLLEQVDNEALAWTTAQAAIGKPHDNLALDLIARYTLLPI